MLFDFAGRLRENARLLALLGHYARLAAPDWAAWQDRLMQLEGTDPREVTALHGELIAFDWVEQNAGHVRVRPDGALAECYRATAQGLRDYRRLTREEVAEEQPEAEPTPGPPRRRKAKHAAQSPSPGEERAGDLRSPAGVRDGDDGQGHGASTPADGAVVGDPPAGEIRGP